MEAGADSRCRICGAESREEIVVSGVGRLCPQCLMTGSFFGASGAPKLMLIADQLLDLSESAKDILGPGVNVPEQLAHDQQFDQARIEFLALAETLMASNHPLLAVTVLSRTLRLPGQSAPVYAALGKAAQQMDCTLEAIQHYKTASWLAVKVRDQSLFEDTLQILECLAPDDPWLQKARQQFEEQPDSEEIKCHFCGRKASEAGPLITGDQASVCSTCVKKVMSLDGTVN